MYRLPERLVQYGRLPQSDSGPVPFGKELEDLVEVSRVDDEVRLPQDAPLGVDADAAPGGRDYVAVAAVIDDDRGVRPPEPLLTEHPLESQSLAPRGVAVSQKAPGEDTVLLLEQDSVGAVGADVGGDALDDLLRDARADQHHVVADLLELRAELARALHQVQRVAHAREVA